MKRKHYWIFLVILFHVSGMIGILTSSSDWFLSFTPLILGFNFVALLVHHEKKGPAFSLLTSIIVVAGFGIEWLGVNTGLIFGSYEYGPIFGPQLAHTPVLIGLNWFVLCYSTTYLIQSRVDNFILAILLSALTICLIDVVMEPVAIKYNFWTWAQVEVPVQNYVAWFIIAAIFSALQMKILPSIKNPIAIWILGAQILFFVVMHFGR